MLAVLRGGESRVLVSRDDISPMMKHAIVSVEDKRFYEHHGVDLRGIMRAVYGDVRPRASSRAARRSRSSSSRTRYVRQRAVDRAQAARRRRSPGSSSTTALVEGPHPHRVPEHDLLRERRLRDPAGVARRTSATAPSKLTLAEAALLAGIPSDPSLYDPVAHPRAASRAAAPRPATDASTRATSPTRQFVHASRAPLPKPEDVHLPGDQDPAPYFTNYVKQQLVDKYGAATRVRRRPPRDDDDRPRAAADRARRDREVAARAGRAARGARRDRPANRRVLAMVGGSNYRASQFNLAVQGERQPGSSFKPFVLATALQEGISPQSTFVSKPIDDLPRRHVVDGAQLRGLVPRPDRPATATIQVGQHRLRAADEGSSGPRRSSGTAHELGITSQLDGVLLDRARRPGRQPARDGARVRDVRERRLRIDGKGSRTSRARSAVKDANGKRDRRQRAGAEDAR